MVRKIVDQQNSPSFPFNLLAPFYATERGKPFEHSLAVDAQFLGQCIGRQCIVNVVATDQTDFNRCVGVATVKGVKEPLAGAESNVSRSPIAGSIVTVG